MRNKILGIIVGILAASSLLVGGQALASHKAWVLKNAGAECSFVTGGVFFGGDGGSMTLTNFASYNRSAVCPITAAGRWGSSQANYNFSPKRWAEAKKAYVHVYNGNSNTGVTCQAVARLRVSLAPGGSLYYGTARSVSGVGYHTIELIPTIDGPRSWGGGLETEEQARIRSLDFQCTVPGTEDMFTTSAIRGYGVATCQNVADCWDNTSLDFREGETSIQGNGSNCTSGDVGVIRDAGGLTATASGLTTVVCPIVPPSQDSHEHNDAKLRRVRLYYVGAGFAGCEQAGTCPFCILQWENRAGTSYNESLPFTWDSTGVLAMPNAPNGTSNPSSMEADSATAIRCYLTPQQRIRGYTAWASQTRVSGGQ